jgi:hypothetical protein
MGDKRQKNPLVLAFLAEDTGEAPRTAEEGTESLTAKRKTESPAIGEQLTEEVCGRENCKQALSRVKANKGSPGVDGMKVGELPGYLKQHWPAIREQLFKHLRCWRILRSGSGAGCGLRSGSSGREDRYVLLNCGSGVWAGNSPPRRREAAMARGGWQNHRAFIMPCRMPISTRSGFRD